MSPSESATAPYDIAASAQGSEVDTASCLTQPAASAVTTVAGPLTPDAAPALKRRTVQPRHLSGGDAGPSASWDGRRLYWFDEAPPPLQYNQYVRSGYRAGLSYGQCLCSIFQYHNETGNIWMHLLALLALTAALLSGWLTPWPTARWAFWEHVLPIALVFFNSVAYHTCQAHHQSYRQWLLFDMCGVYVLFVASMHRLLYWGMFCHPRLYFTFLALYYGSAAACLLAGVKATTALQRGAPLGMLLLVRFAALGTRVAWHTGPRPPCIYYAIMEACTMAGAIINVLRIPERWCQPPGKRKPGRFDFWLNSHQLMHILVTIAMLCLNMGVSLDYQLWSQHPGCPV